MRRFRITGMNCGHCSSTVQKTIAALPGVTNVEVSFPEGVASVEGTTPAADIERAVEELGYRCKEIREYDPS